MHDANNWLKGHRAFGDMVVINHVYCCAGCGEVNFVAYDPLDRRVSPDREPDWPFPVDGCPIHARYFNNIKSP